MHLPDFLTGAIVLANLLIGVFFLRYYRDSRDRFYVFFAASFLIEAAARTLLAILSETAERAVWAYLMRLAAYGLIVIAIVDKNRKERVGSTEGT